VIFSDFATTGDGVLTGLQIAAQVARTGKTLKELSAVMTRLPQVLINVKGVDKARVSADPGVAAAVADAEAQLGETGRVLLRPSGTEPVVRVMVEAADEETAQAIAARLAEVVQNQLALA
jgi:phosphoglucosamine mutase